MKPGTYPGLAMGEYLSLPAVSAGMLNTLDNECPRAAWHASWLNPKRERDDGSKVMDAGTVAHAILLEGSEACVCSIDAPDWRTNAAKAERELARTAGKIPLLAHQLPTIRSMVAVACEFIESLKATDARAVYQAFQPGGGQSEVTLVWLDAIDDVPCRARPDRLANDFKLIVDYKTVSRSAEPNAFGRMIGNMGYDVSVAHYRRGVLALHNVLPNYVFLVQEVEPPFLCSLVALEPAYVDFAQRKVARALTKWASCMRANEWPGYPPRVAHIELPAWVANQDEQREMGRSGNAYDVEKLWGTPEALAARDAARSEPVYPPGWVNP